MNEGPDITKLRDECNHWRDQWHVERQHRISLQAALQAAPYASDLDYAERRAEELGRVLRTVLALTSSDDSRLLVPNLQAREMMSRACEEWHVPEEVAQS